MNKLAKVIINDNVEIIHIDNLKDNKNIYCIDCDAPLIAKRGNIKAHHFAHKSNCSCYYNNNMKEGYRTPGGESAIHKLCKDIIKESKYIYVPTHKGLSNKMNFKKVILEYNYDNRFIDAVGITESDKKVAIEIFYKHKVDDEKLNILKNGFDYIIEICITDNDIESMDILKEKVLNGAFNKRWLYLSEHTDIRVKSGYLELKHQQILDLERYNDLKKASKTELIDVKYKLALADEHIKKLTKVKELPPIKYAEINIEKERVISNSIEYSTRELDIICPICNLKMKISCEHYTHDDYLTSCDYRCDCGCHINVSNKYDETNIDVGISY